MRTRSCRKSNPESVNKSMAALNPPNMGPTEDLITQFCAVTGADNQVALSMLTACNSNLELAIGMHMDQGPPGVTAPIPIPGAPSTSSQPSTSAEEAPVRAPIPQIQEQLVEDTYQYGFRGRRRGAARSVFDGFRNFEAEMRHQEQARRASTSSNAAAPETTAASKKRKTLEELFRPPIDLMYKGSFNTAKEAGASSNRWLLVNIQNSKEFPCQVLNRDIWSNPAVKSIVNEHFVFWQVYHDSEEGRLYMQFYNVSDWPYVAVIDPITGENMVVWNKLDCSSFCELVTEFLSTHPSLDGTVSPPSKKPRTQVKDSSIVDATEDAQVQEALRKSVEDAKVRAHQSKTAQDKHVLPVLSDDSSLGGDSDLETFTDSDDDCAVISPVKNTKNTPTSTVAKAATTSIATTSCITGSEQQVDNGESRLKGDTTCSAVSVPPAMKSSTAENGKVSPPAAADRLGEAIEEPSTGGSTEETGSKKNGSGESTWRKHMGSTEDPESRLQIRFPDGKRDQLNIPCSSSLMAVVQYVNECGFPCERFELVTNYPRRKLSYLDLDDSLKTVGLYPQETIFVQER